MKNLIFFSVFLFFLKANAQQTGLSSVPVNFSTSGYPNQSRNIFFYVPSTYNASQKYKVLICLHGQGDDPGSYLTAFSALTTSTIFGPYLILLSPDEGTSHSGFCDPPGEDDGILDVAVAEAKKKYNIDTNYIYLSGLSQGGRAALKIGLDDYKKYRGLMLLTAACHSYSEAQNLTSFMYNYSNGKYIPVCNEVGALDNQYLPIDTEVHNQLQATGTKEQFVVTPNLGHTNPNGSTFYKNCYNFIEGNATAVNEAAEESIGITVYPNPSPGNILINLHADIQEFEHINTSIYDSQGRKVYSVVNNYLNGILGVDLNYLPSGFYFAIVSTPHYTRSQKFMLNK